MLLPIPPRNSPANSQLQFPLRTYTTEQGYRVALYDLPLKAVPADFFADPDGSWTFETLVEAAGFELGSGVAVGALRLPFQRHPDGAAVVTLNAESRPYIAILECPIAYDLVADASRTASSAA
jgi:hypothetical protein